MGKFQAVICGYYGKGNGGDEALLVSLLQMLPKQVKPIVLSGNPEQTSKLYGVESCSRNDFFSILKANSQSNFFIWGGGSLIQDVTSFNSPFYYNGLMALAQQQGLKTIAWAQGIGPIKSPFHRLITEKVLQKCSAVSVRDRASAELVNNCQIPAIMAPDPVWALESLPVPDLCKLRSPKVAVCWRPHPLLTAKRLEILTKALIYFQQATNTCILLVPFQPVKDEAIANYIASRLVGDYQIVSLSNPRELKGLFRSVEFTIGMRYHSLIMAAANANRCFALSYDPKVTHLIKELNLSGWELEQIPEDPNLISTIWLQEYVNGEPLSNAQIESLVDRALMHQQLLTNVIGENL